MHADPPVPPLTPVEPLSVSPGPEPAVAPRSWGFWPTLGWSVLVLGSAMISITVMMGLALGVLSALTGERDLEGIYKRHEGLIIGVSSPIMAGIVLAAVWLLVYVRGWSLRDYVALRRPRIVPVAFWLAALAVFVVLEHVASTLAERPVPEFMRNAYHTAGSLPLLVIAIVILAPLWEELFFRGFMLRGFAELRGRRATGVSTLGAVALSSALFALTHSQYEWFEVAVVFFLGLLLGAARWHTGTTTVPMIMHAVMNLYATAMLALGIYTGELA